jgi:hypothetical protein
MGGGPPLLAESDIDSLARDFLRSPCVGAIYIDWPLDRRIDTFLRRRDLTRVADDGDLSEAVLDRVVAHAGVVPRNSHDLAARPPVGCQPSDQSQ